MTKLGIKLVGLLVILVWATGCATTMSDVIRSKEEGRGTSKVYSLNADQAWDIAKTVFRQEGTDVIEEHRSEGYMLTSSVVNILNNGTVMGAWIDPVEKDSTKVTVVTKRRDPTDISTTLTETTFHKRFAEAVETVKRSDRMPSKPPSTEPQEISPTNKPTVSAPGTSPPATSPSATSIPVSPPATTIVTVTWTFANIRSGAGNNYPVVTTVKQGDKLTVIGELGEWFNVRLEDGKEGWISNKVVK